MTKRQFEDFRHNTIVGDRSSKWFTGSICRSNVLVEAEKVVSIKPRLQS